MGGCLRVVCWFVLCVVGGYGLFVVSAGVFFVCFFWGCSSIEDVGECNGVSFGFSRGCSNRVFLMVFCLWLRGVYAGVLWRVVAVCWWFEDELGFCGVP